MRYIDPGTIEYAESKSSQVCPEYLRMCGVAHALCIFNRERRQLTAAEGILRIGKCVLKELFTKSEFMSGEIRSWKECGPVINLDAHQQDILVAHRFWRLMELPSVICIWSCNGSSRFWSKRMYAHTPKLVPCNGYNKSFISVFWLNRRSLEIISQKREIILERVMNICVASWAKTMDHLQVEIIATIYMAQVWHLVLG